MLFAIVDIFLLKGSVDYNLLNFFSFSNKTQLLLWICFFISLSVKVPLFPFHIWLPEAHVEAPTVGSVILAGVLLKMGTYGILRFIIPIFPFANWYFGSLVQILTFLAIVYVSIITLCQIDLKKLIAYSSVAHMGYAVIAAFVLKEEAIQSSILLMLNHGLVSSALFLMIGIVYDRYKTRILFYFQALYKVMPLFTILSFLIILANISFPGTSSFFAEFLIMYSLVLFNKYLAFYNSIGLLFSGIYSFWLFNRIFYGLFSTYLRRYSDITLRELLVIIPLLILVFIFPFYSEFVYNVLEFSSKNLLQLNYYNFMF
jgi:proton-translocating NADH-quinone oxidoreductase chain M